MFCKVFVFESAIERFTVAIIFNSASAYAVPKSKSKVLPVGEPDNVNIGLPSALLPVKLNTLPFAPAEAALISLIETI